ncbi:hypothetical protein CERSUDRAFT_95856 [Gelatoporia subvermispora B]|uniref:Uncharacterized protein n=1 Tax=Ceriporiopsis subvermispora (strain B) TaxID=914234 RepID=M2PJZ8_CERS8|nr:hypothetical protein CERSUDRAFT_95856 [Gelatoporia subvermispora B]
MRSRSYAHGSLSQRIAATRSDPQRPVAASSNSWLRVPYDPTRPASPLFNRGTPADGPIRANTLPSHSLRTNSVRLQTSQSIQSARTCDSNSSSIALSVEDASFDPPPVLTPTPLHPAQPAGLISTTARHNPPSPSKKSPRLPVSAPESRLPPARLPPQASLPALHDFLATQLCLLPPLPNPAAPRMATPRRLFEPLLITSRRRWLFCYVQPSPAMMQHSSPPCFLRRPSPIPGHLTFSSSHTLPASISPPARGCPFPFRRALLLCVRP